MLEPASYSCPHCGESVETFLDPSAGDQTLTEDCPVCCCPVLLTISVARDGTARLLGADRENG